MIGKTAAEIITSRADAKHPTMGLLTWKGYRKGGKIQLSDTKIAKNYMMHDELGELTSLVNLCLDSASLTVKRGRPISRSKVTISILPYLNRIGYIGLIVTLTFLPMISAIRKMYEMKMSSCVSQ